MPAKGIREAKRKTRQIAGKITGEMSERTLTELLITAQGFATLMTPADTGNLRNSQYRIVRAYGGGVKGQIGYTAKYAAAVHNAPGKLKGKPRADFGRTREGVGFGGGTGVGNYWDPFGEPKFLEKAFEGSNLQAIDAVVRRGMRL